MIYDTIENLSKYPGFELIIRFLDENDVAAVPAKSYDLGSGISANISDYAPGKGGLPEAHRDYADLQLVVRGNELIEVFPLATAVGGKGYKPDIEFYEGSSVTPCTLVLNENCFAYLAPQDVHRPCIRHTAAAVRKIVFKIPILR